MGVRARTAAFRADVAGAACTPTRYRPSPIAYRPSLVAYRRFCIVTIGNPSAVRLGSAFHACP